VGLDSDAIIGRRTVDNEEVRAIVGFFTRDSDAERFCGLRAGATEAEVEQRFGEGCFPFPGRATFEGREVEVTKVSRSGPVVLGPTTYKCLVEVLLPVDPALGFPQVDVRLVREGYVMKELKAAAAELKTFFSGLHGPKMRFLRDGARVEMWIEAGGVKKADERVGLTPCASLRVQASRRGK
jgi:hypothetical protein